MSAEHTLSEATGAPVAKPAWYRRRAPQVAMAGAVAAALTVGGLSAGFAANAEVEPQQAVADARDNLKDTPTAVTITGLDGEEGQITLTRTDEGAQVEVQAPERGVDFGLAMVGERLYLRADVDQLDALAANPMAAGIASTFPSLNALLSGNWVSIDVSEDSEVLAALKDAGAGKIADPESFEAAGEELRGALEDVGTGLKDAFAVSLEANVAVTTTETQLTGPDGSEHYQVAVDAGAMVTELEPLLRESLNSVLAAMDTFMADAGEQLPFPVDEWETKRAEAVEKFDTALEDRSGDETGTIDVWIEDGNFTQISAEKAQFTFEQDPKVDAPTYSTSMDQDLLTILPLLGGFSLPALGGV